MVIALYDECNNLGKISYCDNFPSLAQPSGKLAIWRARNLKTYMAFN